MGFNLMMMRPGDPNEPLPVDDWAERLRAAIPDIDVSVCSSEGEAMEVIGEADAAFGDIMTHRLLDVNVLAGLSGPDGH